jgi:hypothetical protein
MVSADTAMLHYRWVKQIQHGQQPKTNVELSLGEENPTFETKIQAKTDVELSLGDENPTLKTKN